MHDIKEKLVELLKCDPCPSTLLCDGNCNYAELERCFEERFADHLIANGVTIAEDKDVLTNADRIRSMSDEELASVMYGLVDLDEHIHFCQNKTECDTLLSGDKEIPKENCVRCLIKWLQQPAEEVHHE